MKKILLMLAVAFCFAACEKEKRDCPSASEKVIALTGFNRIKTGENFEVRVTQGTTYSVKAKGCSNDLDDLSAFVDPLSGFLNVQYNSYKKDRYKVELEVTLPSLRSFVLSGVAKATITGFGSQTSTLSTVLSGTADVAINQLPPRVEVDMSGTSVLNLSGTTAMLTGNLSGAAQLKAYGATATEVDISVSGTVKAYVVPVQKLTASASGASRIYYKGNPAERYIDYSGEARVIKE